MMNFGRLSLNFDKKKRLNRQIKLIVFHYTGMQSKVEALKKLCNSKSKVSCHYFIDEIGNIVRIVPEKFSAWHAGKSSWKNFKFLNKFSIGIELVNPGHDFGYRKFSKKQIYSLKKISKKIIAKYNIIDSNIVGHSDISPLRKKDPGEKFPWKELANSKIGIWHKLKTKELKNAQDHLDRACLPAHTIQRNNHSDRSGLVRLPLGRNQRTVSEHRPAKGQGTAA